MILIANTCKRKFSSRYLGTEGKVDADLNLKVFHLLNYKKEKYQWVTKFASKYEELLRVSFGCVRNLFLAN